MSCDSYYRHKVIMEIGAKKDGGTEPERFKDDRELLAFLLEQEKKMEMKWEASQDLECSA